jgi:hypothetical protein
VALLAFIGVAGVLVVGVYALGGQRQPVEAIETLTAAQRAFQDAETALAAVSGPGIDLIADDRDRALDLLNTAYAKLEEAAADGYPASRIAPLRKEALAGLDRLYEVKPVASRAVFTFPAEKPVKLTALVRGSDGAPYVLDTANKTVWRLDIAKKTATAVLKTNQKASGTRTADPVFLTLGGPDVLVLDAKNNLWRWRPSNNAGKGTLVRIKVKDSASWGDDIRDISTFVANFDAAFYKLYVVDPSEQNIMVLSPANDGSGYPVLPNPRLPTERDVSGITDLLIDGDIYVAEAGQVARVIPAAGWEAEPPEDTTVRPDPRYTLIASPDRPDGTTSRRNGLLYAFDAENDRVVAFNKADGGFVEQYRLAAGGTGWAGLRGFVVLPSADPEAPATMWWINDTQLNSALLQPVSDEVQPSPSPSDAASPSAPAKTPKPTKTPKA